MRDAVQAVVTFLKADSDLITLFDDHVDNVRAFGEELPGSEAEFMPRRAIVVRRVGGIGGYGGRLQLETGILDVACYGRTPLEAETLRETVRASLKELQREVVNGTLLHSLTPATSPVSARDADGKWPYVVEAWEFLASECQAS